jgi:6-phosphofructokinase 1
MISTGDQLSVGAADLAVDQLGEPSFLSPMAWMLRGRARSPHYVHESDRVLLDDTAAQHPGHRREERRLA